MVEEKILNIKEAAEKLGVKVNTLYSWVNFRKIEYVKVGRLVKFKQSSIEKFINDNCVPMRDKES